jgi:hypothetical protein
MVQIITAVVVIIIIVGTEEDGGNMKILVAALLTLALVGCTHAPPPSSGPAPQYPSYLK